MHSYQFSDEYIQESIYYEETYDIVPIENHANAGDALYAIMEQLYDSANGINEKAIRGSFAYLCDKLGVEKNLLEDPNGLCVVHWKEKTNG